MHYNITENIIKLYTNGIQSWQNGQKLQQNHSVGILSGWDTQFIHTTVIDSKVYEVQLAFFIDGELEKSSCTCDHNFSKEAICPHVIASLLQMMKKQEIILEKENLSKQLFEENKSAEKEVLSSALALDGHVIEASVFSDIIKELEQIDKASNKNIVQMKVQLEFSNSKYLYGYTAALSIKVGMDRAYIVKDLMAFMEAVEREESFDLSRHFSFNNKIHTFLEDDKRIILFLLEVYEEERIRQKNKYLQDKTSYVFQEKNVLLSSSRFIRLCELLSEKSFEIISSEGMAEGFIKYTIPETNYYVEKIESGVLLKRKTDKQILEMCASPLALFDRKSIIYIPNSKEESIYRALEALFSDSDEVLMPDSLLSRFMNSFYPILKDFDCIDLSEDIQKRLVSSKLLNKVYLDVGRSGIELRIAFDYNGTIIDPFKEVEYKATENIILRNKEKEKTFLDFLASLDLESKHFGYLISGDDMEYRFITELLPKLRKMANVYGSNEYNRQSVIHEKDIYHTVRLSEDNNYLEYAFTIDGISETELKQVLRSYKQKKKYHKLRSGEFLSLEGQVFELTGKVMETFDSNRVNVDSKIELPMSAAFYIEQNFDGIQSRFINKDQLFETLVSRLKSGAEGNLDLTEGLAAVLREYQLSGVKWLVSLAQCSMGGVLADDMGLGKTLQMLTFILNQKRKGTTLPNLIVAPTSLIYNWASEIEKFTPELKYKIIHGIRNERENQLKEGISENDILITSYATFRRDVDCYTDHNFASVILDEAQHIKNERSKASKSVKTIRSQHRFALTGTPLENHLGELWSIFDFVLPGHLGTREKFFEHFEKPIVKGFDQERANELISLIKPFMLRRLKKDVLEELPEKMETTITVEMTDTQKVIYAATVTKIKEDIKEQIQAFGAAKNKIKILAGLIRLRQICSHPAAYLENYSGTSGKFEAVEELLAELKEAGHRTLVFSQFTSVLKILKEHIEQMGYQYFYLDGSTRVKEREKLVHAFNKGVGDVFLISLKAGGTGLNLTGADTVIHFDPWWNPSVEDQASDRIYRIGQKKDVHIMRLLTRGTIEEKILKLQNNKRALVDQIIQPGETFISSLDENELMNLFDWDT